MDRRILAESAASYVSRGHHEYGIRTTIPKHLVNVLGITDGSYVHWERAGSYYRVLCSVSQIRGGSKVKPRPSCLAGIPKPVSARMGLKVGDRIEWLLAAAEKRPLEVHARKKAARPPRAVTTRRGRAQKSFAVLGSYAINREKPGRPFRASVVIPKPFIRMLCAADATHAGWEKVGPFYRLVPGGGSYVISRIKKPDGCSNNIINMPKEAARDLCSGGPRLYWLAGSDGLGDWGLYAAPSS